MIYPSIRIRNKEEFRLLGGHLWAFSNELLDLPKDLEAGSIVTLVRERDGAPIATGFFNPHSLIAFRLLTRNTGEVIDSDFFERRIHTSAERRSLLATRRNAYRIVHGESDFLPGLIIDRFNDVLSFQIVSAGFEAKKDLIVEILQKLFQPKAIVEKNNSNLRKLEGLTTVEALSLGSDASTQIHDEAGVRFQIDVLAGQKTGSYLDQMENHTRLRDFIRPGARVLDLFANDGGFGINAALAGAESVLAVDESGSALERLRRNAGLNEVSDKISSVAANCFDFLRESRDMFDVIILDPPALAKSKKDLTTARKAYVGLNSGAMKLLRQEGILITCSCSHHVSRDMLLEAVGESGRKANRTVTVLEARGAGIDHPILAAMPETEYLKVLVLRVC